MTIAESFLPEFDAEMAATRRLLERVPGDRLDWKPHPKSKSLGELAIHIGELPRFGLRFNTPEWTAGSEKPPVMRSTAEILARFDGNVAAGRASIAAKTDEEMAQDFTVLRPNGEVFFRRPRTAIVRLILLNHIIHHRGQLTVYLRLNDVPLPPIYGPTADESI